MELIKQFEGQRIKRIRSATENEYNRVYTQEMRDEMDEPEPLMVAELENGAKLYLMTERTENERNPDKEEIREVAIAETTEKEIIEIQGEII